MKDSVPEYVNIVITTSCDRMVGGFCVINLFELLAFCPHFLNHCIGSVRYSTPASFIIVHILLTVFDPFMLLRNSWFLHGFLPYTSKRISHVSLALCCKVTQKFNIHSLLWILITHFLMINMNKHLLFVSQFGHNWQTIAACCTQNMHRGDFNTVKCNSFGHTKNSFQELSAYLYTSRGNVRKRRIT